MSFKQVINRLEDKLIRSVVESSSNKNKDSSKLILTLRQDANNSNFIFDYYKVINTKHKSIKELVPAKWISEIDKDLKEADIPFFNIYDLKREPKMKKLGKERLDFTLLAILFSITSLSAALAGWLPLLRILSSGEIVFYGGSMLFQLIILGIYVIYLSIAIVIYYYFKQSEVKYAEKLGEVFAEELLYRAEAVKTVINRWNVSKFLPKHGRLCLTTESGGGALWWFSWAWRLLRRCSPRWRMGTLCCTGLRC